MAPADVNTVRSKPGFKVVPSSSPPALSFLFFNVTRKPFDDKRVRQALFGLIDRNYLLKAVYFGHGQAAQAPFGHLLGWAGHPGISYDKMYPTDVEAANKKLDEAGYPRGADGIRFKTSISFGSDAAEELATATVVQEAWKKVGVQVELRSTARNVLIPKVFDQKDFDISYWYYTTFGDPAILGRVWLTSTIGLTFGNGSLYSNPKVDELFAKGAATTKVEERAKYYRDVQEILADDLPSMTLFETVGLDAMSAKVQGIFGYRSNGRWSHAWLEK